jgi:hypothetical protein
MELISKKLLENLYKDERLSAYGISSKLNCSEGRINYWLKKYNIQKRSISEAVYQKYNPEGDPFDVKKVITLNEGILLGLGLGLYWGEGHKKSPNVVKLGNSDPAIINKFIEFLILIFNIKPNKLRFGLQIFSDMPRNKVLNFWMESLSRFNIRKDQFFKVTVTPARSIGTYREKSKYGVCAVYFCNVKLKRIIDSMLPT